MRNLRLPLAAAAAALLLAAMPGSVSALSNEQCRTEWNRSAAASTCTAVSSVVWQSWSEQCRIKVTCTRSDGIATHENDVKAGYYLVYTFHNCDGVLELSLSGC